MTNSQANETQVGGTHYKSSYEHWDFVNDAGLGYFEGQITKYVARWRKKNGLQDLKKANHFLLKLQEIAVNDGQHVQAPIACLEAATKFCNENGLLTNEISVMRLAVLSMHGTAETRQLVLHIMGGAIDRLTNEAQAPTKRVITEVPSGEATSGYVNQDR